MTERNDQTLYWLWLQRTLGCGAKIADVLDVFGDPLTFWQGRENDYRASDCFCRLRSFSQHRLPLLLDKSLDDCREILALCQKQHIAVVTPDDAHYPRRLLLLRDLPAVLYIRGDAQSLNPTNALAVIGARKPTQYAKDAALEMTAALAGEGFTIVSGGAVGIDSAAHEAALDLQRPTLLVMGCGHGAGYLPSNADLRRRVSQCGALVTEYPPLTEPAAGSFQMRNRLISGLSDGVVIIQAGAGSGTLNTASHAKNQGKTLFVLPGSRDSRSFEGSNALLQDGALVVQTGADLLRRCGFTVTAKTALSRMSGEPFSALQQQEAALETPAPRKKTIRSGRKPASDHSKPESTAGKVKKSFVFVPESVSKNARIVYNILQKQPAGLDDLVRAGALPVPQVLSALTELELAGAVTRDEHAIYSCL